MKVNLRESIILVGPEKTRIAGAAGDHFTFDFPPPSGIVVTILADTPTAKMLIERGPTKDPIVKAERGEQKLQETSCRFNEDGSVAVYLALAPDK